MVTTTQPQPTKKSNDTKTTPPAGSPASTTTSPKKEITSPKTPALRLEGTPLPSAPKEPALRLEGTPPPSASKKPALRLEGTPIPSASKKPALRLEGTPIPSASKKPALRLEGTPIPGHPPEDGDSEWGRMQESDSYESDTKGDMPDSGKPKLQLKGTPVHSTPPPLSKKKVRPSTRKPHSKLDSLSIKPAKHNRKPSPLSVSKGSKGKWKSFPGYPPQGDSEREFIPESDLPESDTIKGEDGDYAPESDTTKGEDGDGWAFLPDSATQNSNGWWRPFPAPMQGRGEGLKPYSTYELEGSGRTFCATQLSAFSPLVVSTGEAILFYAVIILFALKMICWAIEFAFTVWSWTVRWAPEIQKLGKGLQTENGSNKRCSADLKSKKTGGAAPH